MNKNQLISFLKKDHQKLADLISKLSPEQKSVKIIGNWTVKEILGHIAEWRWDLVEDIGLILNNKKPWYVGTISTEKYNYIAIQKRRDWPFSTVKSDWEHSFRKLINRIKKLTDTDWNYKSSIKDEEGKTITIKSLLSYSYKAEGHDGGHANQISKKLKLKN